MDDKGNGRQKHKNTGSFVRAGASEASKAISETFGTGIVKSIGYDSEIGPFRNAGGISRWNGWQNQPDTG